jgi:hypothetical protein
MLATSTDSAKAIRFALVKLKSKKRYTGFLSSDLFFKKMSHKNLVILESFMQHFVVKC